MSERKTFRELGFKGKDVWSFRPKKTQQKKDSWYSMRKKGEFMDFEGNNLTFTLQPVRIKLNKTWQKKTFKSSSLEICKTRIKNSSFDMLKFYVISAGRTGSKTVTGLPRPGAHPEPHHYKKIQKCQVLSKTWVSPNNHLILSDQKLKIFTLELENKTKNHKTSKATTEDRPCNQEVLN